VDLDDSLNPINATTRDLAIGRFQALTDESAEGIALSTTVGAGAQDIALAPLDTAGLPLLPAPGTCLAYDSAAGGSYRFLDAGEQIELDGPAGRAAVPRDGDEYRLSSPPGAFFLGAGDYHVEGLGGGSFPPFAAEVSIGEPAALTAIDGTDLEPRAGGFSVEWDAPAMPGVTATPDATLLVGREALAQPPGSAAGVGPARFVCAASSADEPFAIPAAIFANLPDSTAELDFANLWGPRLLEFATDGPESGSLAYLHSQLAGVRLGQPHLPGTPVALPDGAEVHAEVAATFVERQRGLMFRRELPSSAGMLFLFDNPGRYGFWMLNTLVPLDIVWLDSDRRVVFVSENTPPCPPGTACPTYGSEAVAQFVLELAAGQAAAHQLNVGDELAW
jgi:hypothetical protein